MTDRYSMGNNMKITSSGDNCSVFQMRSGDGNGVMTMYHVLEGIQIIYNDFHMSGCKSEFVPEGDMFCVDHCREGRIEQEIKPGVYRYIEAGDLRIDNRVGHDTEFFFPLVHYHGITVGFDVCEADNSIRKIFPIFL